MFDGLTVAVSKEEVTAQNTNNVLATLKSLLETPEKAKSNKENLDLVFHGYDSDSRELSEILEVRDFVFSLDEEFPYWLFFSTKLSSSLQNLFLCLAPPYLTDEAKTRVLPQRLEDLLTNRWLPALNHVSRYVGLSDHEIEALTEQSVSYFVEGPIRFSR
jgi:hypothetical protein